MSSGNSAFVLVAVSQIFAIVAVMASFTPIFVGYQTHAWRKAMEKLEELGIELFSSGSSTSSTLTVAAILSLFFGIRVLQSALLGLVSIFDVEQQWYLKQQKHVRGNFH